MSGFKFANKHNENDMNAPLIDKSIQSPSKNKIKESVPFMNGTYDFSTVATNGEPTYTEREIRVNIALPTTSKRGLYLFYSKVLEWLMDSGKSQLIFDDMPDFYFMAEVESTPSFEEVITFGTLEITFIAEPFKYGTDLVGHELWDNINFDTFVFQDTVYSVSGSRIITIYNEGRMISPDVIVSANMSCVLNGYTANFTTAISKDYKFKLLNGYNTITVNGTGSIEFRFRKTSI